VRNEALVVVMLLLLAAGCSPTVQQITEMKNWSARARKSCATPGSCPEPAACIRAVVDATRSDAGHAEYAKAKQACWSYAGGDK